MADEELTEGRPEEEQQAEGPPAVEVWNDYDPSMRFVAVFPVREDQGASASSVAYYIIEPGKHTGLHGDNAEEIVYVFEGEGEAFITGKQVRLQAGEFHVLPAGAEHDIYAYGDRELRFLSFYPVALMESTFQQAIMPMGGNLLTSNPFAPVIQELTLDDLPEDFPFDLLGGGPPEPEPEES